MKEPKTLGYFIVCIIVIAILELLNRLLLKTMIVAGYLTIFFAIIGLIHVFWGGRVSKMFGGHPVGRGALLGAIYGVITGISIFFLHVSAGALQSQLGNSVSSGASQNLANMVNSPTTHVVTFLLGIVIYAVGGLIAAAIGGATAKKIGQ